MKSPRGFSILELLVSLVVLALILVLALSIVSNVSQVASSSQTTFQEARTAFETMSRLLGQAMLNTYWDYDNPSSPQQYIRASELHFVAGTTLTLTGTSLPAGSTAPAAGSAVFFQAPLNQTTDTNLKKMPDLMNSLGFYVRFSASDNLPSYLQTIQSKTSAWRLWMYLQPTESLALYNIYNADPQAPSNLSWFQNDLQDSSKNHVLANNVVLLLIRATYEDSSGNSIDSYVYDSRPAARIAVGASQPVEIHQIPPTLHVTLVVIDQRTADRLLTASNGQSYNLIDKSFFTSGTPFTDATKYSDDMAELQGILNKRPIAGIPIRYRIFETTVTMSSAKWSQF